MTNNMYVVKNDLSGLSEGIYLFPTDKYASVKICDDLSRAGLHLEDFKLFRIGTFDNENLDCCILDNAELIPFDCRHLMEKKSELVEPKEVIENMADIR